jgi:hypothetical protein
MFLLLGRMAACSREAVPAAMMKPMNRRVAVDKPRHEFLWVDIF